MKPDNARGERVDAFASGDASPHPFSARGRALVGQEMFRVLDKARKLEEQGIHVFHLELGNPRYSPPSEIIDITVGALRSLNVGYASSAGLPELRRALAARFTALWGREVDQEHVVVSPANLLISQCLELACDRGDRLVLFSPAFPSYYAASAHIGLEVVDIPLDPNTGYQLTDLDVDAAMAARPKAILINSANNPTGAVYSRSALENLARKCNEANVWLVSDETYSDICFHQPFCSLGEELYPRLVIISSFSKIFSIPGFRIGYAIAHKTVAEKLALSSSTLFSCLPIFTQLGCAAGLRVIDPYTAKLREHFSQVGRRCAEIINRSKFLRCSAPQSGFYIFLDIGATGLDDLSFSSKLLEERSTAVTPGRSFGKAYKTHIRIATCGNLDDVVEGTDQVVSLVDELAS